jgi:hypothetical protein
VCGTLPARFSISSGSSLASRLRSLSSICGNSEGSELKSSHRAGQRLLPGLDHGIGGRGDADIDQTGLQLPPG